LIRDSFDKIVGTKPYHVVDGKIIEGDKFVLYYLPIVPEIIPVLPIMDEGDNKLQSEICNTGSFAIMEKPLPSIIYLQGKTQERLTTLPILSIRPPDQHQSLSKELCELPGLHKIIYAEFSLPTIIHLPGKIYVLCNNHFKIIAVLLILLFYITYFCFDFSVVTSLIFKQSPVESLNIQDVAITEEKDYLESEIDPFLLSDLYSEEISSDELNK
jgi:hypothetical protein